MLTIPFDAHKRRIGYNTNIGIVLRSNKGLTIKIRNFANGIYEHILDTFPQMNEDDIPILGFIQQEVYEHLNGVVMENRKRKIQGYGTDTHT